MKKMKKFFKIFLISIVAVIAMLIASTYIFQNKIVEMVKTQINKNIVAEVDFQKVNISFFRHFPRVSIGLDELEITGIGTFEADTLLSAKRLDAAIDVMSFISGKDMNIYSIHLDKPRIHALVNELGQANWDIVKEDSAEITESESKPFHLKLKKYEISNGYVVYDDRESDMSAEIVNLNHKGSGDFTSDLFTLTTSTTAGELTYTYGAVPYLYKVKTSVDADLKIDNIRNLYSFENLVIFLNELKITGEGEVSDSAGGYKMNIGFRTAETDFKNILSLIPAVYKKEFDKVTASGSAGLEGKVRGIYSDASMPGYHIALAVKDGAFKYSDLPKGVQKINIDAVVDNPDGETDHTVIDIKKAHFEIDKNPFDFRLFVKNPVSLMYVDASAKGKLDLSQIGSFVKLEKGTGIGGLLNADVTVKGNVSDLEKQQYTKFYADGVLALNGFQYTSEDYPTGIKINTLQTGFTPSRINLSNFSGEYLGTTFTGTGQINNLLNYIFSNQPLNADININADKIYLNDWMGVSEDTASAEAPSPFVVPANLEVNLAAKVNELVYEKLNIRNLAGSLLIHDQTVNLNNIHGNALDGSISISGSYSTKVSKTNPAIALTYNVNQVDIQKTFYAFNTAQKLMPVGRFLAGKLTSSLTANGKLGEGMDVDLGTLSGAGNVLLIEGFLSKFAPLDKIASTLHVTELEQISLKDVKAFFEFTNGKMLVKPFTVKIKGIEMEIGGLQGFDESIDYTINLKLPRALIGDQGNSFINNLATSASSRGIPVNLGETVPLKLNLTGTVKKPMVKVDLKQTGETLAAQMKEQVKEFAQAKIDSAKSATADTLKAIKNTLADAAREELRRQLLGKKDSSFNEDSSGTRKKVSEKAKESARGLLKNLLRKDSTER